jgi:hypothetical protein
MERLLLGQNQRHLQQTKIEGGTRNSYPMPQFRQSMGINTDTDAQLKGRFTTDYKVPPPVAAWIKAVTQTDCEKALPDVVGSLSKDEFQQMFRHGVVHAWVGQKLLNCYNTFLRVFLFRSTLANVPLRMHDVNQVLSR